MSDKLLLYAVMRRKRNRDVSRISFSFVEEILFFREFFIRRKSDLELETNDESLAFPNLSTWEGE